MTTTAIPVNPSWPTLLRYTLTKTTNRLTFDILEQAESIRYRGEDDGPYYKFVASNGYEIYSRSRMDIQTERIWLLGAKENDRSGSMVFSSNEKRDAAYQAFKVAIDEWAYHNGGLAQHCTLATEPPRFPPIQNRDAWIGAKPGWYIKDYADGWIYFPPELEEDAKGVASEMGALIREVKNGVCRNV
jgi:hypothetical protein